jgi:hypothetical protein
MTDKEMERENGTYAYLGRQELIPGNAMPEHNDDVDHVRQHLRIDHSRCYSLAELL